jgi:hypothetical protein
MTILGALLVQPSAVKAHEVVEPIFMAVERVMKKRATRGAQGSPVFLIFSQFIQQHGQDECAGIVVSAVSFGKIWDTENSMLENSG